jgi:hypothetical protein
MLAAPTAPTPCNATIWQKSDCNLSLLSLALIGVGLGSFLFVVSLFLLYKMIVAYYHGNTIINPSPTGTYFERQHLFSILENVEAGGMIQSLSWY